MTTQTEIPPASVTQTPQRRRFTVAEYYAMADAGVLAHTERVELLDGEIIVMPPIGNRHQSGVDRLGETWILQLQGRAHVRVQGPVRLDDGSEPQPDLMLLSRRDDFYETAHPGPSDVMLLIEVADSTLEFDRNEKLQLYASAGIPEVWIVNLRDRRVEAYTAPVDGAYTNIRHFEIGENVSPQHFPDIALPVERIIPA